MGTAACCRAGESKGTVDERLHLTGRRSRQRHDRRRRRTQVERREQTIGRIVDATINALCELGYTRTGRLPRSAYALASRRAGCFATSTPVSTSSWLAAQEVSRRQLVTFNGTAGRNRRLAANILELTRAATRAPINRGLA